MGNSVISISEPVSESVSESIVENVENVGGMIL